ncbi:hypothetical protein ACIB24_14840 [Spongisporangium articulatum]|uniref:Uncharacterized protein n=1 Tax=Spongisporangium articulatum TaxID=3362603 RepID=A0ABW8APN2_9ACTN
MQTGTSILGPLAVLTAAIIALLGVGATVRQKSKTDRREQWWKRAEWSLDQIFHTDEARQRVGFAVLLVLADSRLATSEEFALLDAAADVVIDSAEINEEDQDEDHDGGLGRS